MNAEDQVRFEGIHCTMEILRPAPGVAVVAITGSDVGEFRDAPFRALEEDFDPARPLELFVDGRNAQGATVDVSETWARWLRDHREDLGQVTMLASSRLVQLTADVVRRYSELGERMQVTSDGLEFDAALAEAVEAARAE